MKRQNIEFKLNEKPLNGYRTAKWNVNETYNHYTVNISDSYHSITLFNDEIEELYNILGDVLADRKKRVEKSDEPMKLEELQEFDLSVRAYGVLKRGGINEVRQMKDFTMEDLMKFRNMGRKHATEIYELLQKLDFTQIK